MSSVFNIYSPEDCDFYYDGELQGHIEGNSKMAFRFEAERKGMYLLKFINSKYQTELIMEVSIEADEEREVELDFSEVNEPVIRQMIINAIEHDYEPKEEHFPEEIISAISKDGILTIPKGVRKIGNYAFFGCISLTSITIPDSVTEIGEAAFANCTSLTSITIPDSVTEIGLRAFAWCKNLPSVTIPNSITTIESHAFEECYGLTAFYGKYASMDNRCLIIDGKLLAFAPYEITKYTIPNGVTSIGDYAFCGCMDLISITIPDSVTTIGEMTFLGCSELTSISISHSVTAIGRRAFARCGYLTDVYCKATTPPKLEDSVFRNYTSKFKI